MESTQYKADYVMVDGRRIAIKTAGSPDSPPLLMVHGWMSYYGVWRTLVPALQDHFFCVMVDLLGFGDSDKVPGGDYSIMSQARRVLAVADHFGFEKFNLIGHSMGGQTVLTVASLLVPERVLKVIDVSGVVAAKLMPGVEEQLPTIQFGEKFPILYMVSRWLIDFEWFAKPRFSLWFYDMESVPFNEWSVDRHRFYQKDARYGTQAAYHAMYAHDLTPHLQKITAPTLCIFGKQDAVVPTTDGELVAEHVPGSKMVWIDKCGHFPMQEKREEYIEAVKSFLL